METTCDNCNKQLKKKKHKNCKHVFCDMKCRDEFRSNQIPTYSCSNCSEPVKKQKRKNHVFCNLKCRDEFRLNKYCHLTETFESHPNEIAYLFGLMLGDGHWKKSGKKTTRISIAFNLSDDESLFIADEVFDKLQIQYFVEPKTPNNCKTLGFILPNEILKKYNLLFQGSKYDNQPKCKPSIVKNINFALGLLNSDGCLCKNNISFINTVDSIIHDFKTCLLKNKINHKEYSYEQKNKTWKPTTQICIMRKESRKTILEQRYCKWKLL